MRFLVFWTFIIGSLPFIFRRPLYGLVLYSIFNIVRPEMLFWGSARGAKVFLILIGTTLLAFLVKRMIQPSLALRWHLLLIFWIFLALVVSMQLSDYQVSYASYYAIEVLKVFVLCYLLTRALEADRDLSIFLDALLYTTAALALWGVEQFLRGNYRLEGLGGNAFSDSNYAAAHFVLFLPLAMAKFMAPRRRFDRPIGFLCTGALVAVILCTLSRGGLLGLAMAIVAFVVQSRRRGRLIVFGLIVAILVAPFMTEQFAERLQPITGEQDLDTSALSRLILWQAGWLIFLDHPFFGAGFMAFPYAKTEYVDRVKYKDPDYRDEVLLQPKVTHNTVIQILSEGGLFLMVPWATLFVGTLLKNRRIIRRDRQRREDDPRVARLMALQSGLIGFLTCMMFLEGVVGVFQYVMVTIAAVARDQIAANPLASLAEGGAPGPSERSPALPPPAGQAPEPA